MFAIDKMMDALHNMIIWVAGPPSQFKVQDAVQLKEGSGELMIIIEVINERGMKEPLLYCHWTENGKINRTNLFHEHKLEFFDWNKANKNK
ncbi:MAG: hypothetical protein JNJ65_00730 [Cyclobacteriaceae bacterium]|jgi:uncharacterized protein YodC (DUF2158 family)|nr:hypothetical protein [Cyclobacteriaceae bacterium]